MCEARMPRAFLFEMFCMLSASEILYSVGTVQFREKKDLQKGLCVK